MKDKLPQVVAQRHIPNQIHRYINYIRLALNNVKGQLGG